MCHFERSEGFRFLAQGKLREESDTKCHPERSEDSHEFLRFAQDMLRLTPQNDIVTRLSRGEGEGGGDKAIFYVKNFILLIDSLFNCFFSFWPDLSSKWDNCIGN